MAYVIDALNDYLGELTGADRAYGVYFAQYHLNGASKPTSEGIGTARAAEIQQRIRDITGALSVA